MHKSLIKGKEKTMDKISALQKQANSTPTFEKYKETNVRDNTNCYSHALGLTLPYPELYCRIGAISGKKPIDQDYFSIEEIKTLLFSDCETLHLGIKTSSLEEKLISSREYKIALFVKIWGNGKIAGCHFWRYENGIWTEKWPGRGMNVIQDFQRDKLDYFPWNFVGIYKISKNESAY